MPVQHPRDRVDVRDDPGHVRGGGEAADLQRAVGVAAELGLEVREVDPPVVVLADRDDVGAGLAPGQLVRVVLVGPDEDDGPLRARASRSSTRMSLSIAAVRPSRRTRRRRPSPPLTARWMMRRASSRSAVVCRPVADASVCVLAYSGRTRVADVVLDERQRATRGRGVGVDEPARAERPVDDRVVADHRAADPLDQRLRLLSAPEHRGRTGVSRGGGGSARGLPAVSGSRRVRSRTTSGSGARAAFAAPCARVARTAKSALMARRYGGSAGLRYVEPP